MNHCKYLLCAARMAVAATFASLFFGTLACADIVVNAVETPGGDVVISGGGTIDDLTGLSPLGTFAAEPSGVNPGFPAVIFNADLVDFDVYEGVTASGTFGPINNFFAADSSIGGTVAVGGTGGTLLGFATDYVLGTQLDFSMTFNGQTFQSLEMTQGTYVWSWGDGGQTSGDSFTLNVIPEPTSAIGIGLLAIGITTVRRRRIADAAV